MSSNQALIKLMLNPASAVDLRSVGDLIILNHQLVVLILVRAADIKPVVRRVGENVVGLPVAMSHGQLIGRQCLDLLFLFGRIINWGEVRIFFITSLCAIIGTQLV